MFLYNGVEEVKAQIDRFLPETDEAVKAFLGVVTTLAADDNDTALLVDEISNHAISKTPAYRAFVNQFLGLPRSNFSKTETKTEVSEMVQ